MRLHACVELSIAKKMAATAETVGAAEKCIWNTAAATAFKLCPHLQVWKVEAGRELSSGAAKFFVQFHGSNAGHRTDF